MCDMLSHICYLAAVPRPNCRLILQQKNRLIALRFHLRVGLEQAFLTAQRVASKAPENGRLKRVKARWKLLELSKSGVVALRFLGFLLRINFDNMLARCNIGGRLLPDRRKIISG
jgi:hypothetical protein